MVTSNVFGGKLFSISTPAWQSYITPIRDSGVSPGMRTVEEQTRPPVLLSLILPSPNDGQLSRGGIKVASMRGVQRMGETEQMRNTLGKMQASDDVFARTAECHSRFLALEQPTVHVVVRCLIQSRRVVQLGVCLVPPINHTPSFVSDVLWCLPRLDPSCTECCGGAILDREGQCSVNLPKVCLFGSWCSSRREKHAENRWAFCGNTKNYVGDVIDEHHLRHFVLGFHEI